MNGEGVVFLVAPTFSVDGTAVDATVFGLDIRDAEDLADGPDVGSEFPTDASPSDIGLRVSTDVTADFHVLAHPVQIPIRGDPDGDRLHA